ncbi:MAG: HupE/UreJ family protein, partial [Sphingobacteriaceae bacterium]
GKEESVVMPLLYFNLGLEVGQLLIVFAVVILNMIMAFLFKVPFQLYKLILVSVIGIIALKVSIERLIHLYHAT